LTFFELKHMASLNLRLKFCPKPSLAGQMRWFGLVGRGSGRNTAVFVKFDVGIQEVDF
jgi:hypothetical protein